MGPGSALPHYSSTPPRPPDPSNFGLYSGGCSRSDCYRLQGTHQLHRESTQFSLQPSYPPRPPSQTIINGYVFPHQFPHLSAQLSANARPPPPPSSVDHYHFQSYHLQQPTPPGHYPPPSPLVQNPQITPYHFQHQPPVIIGHPTAPLSPLPPYHVASGYPSPQHESLNPPINYPHPDSSVSRHQTQSKANIISQSTLSSTYGSVFSGDRDGTPTTKRLKSIRVNQNLRIRSQILMKRKPLSKLARRSRTQIHGDSKPDQCGALLITSAEPNAFDVPVETSPASVPVLIVAAVTESTPKHLEQKTHLGNHVDMLGLNSQLKKLVKFCNVNDAQEMFDKRPKRDAVRTSMIAGYDCRSRLSDLNVHELKLLGCSYDQSCVGVWVVDISRIEPYSTSNASRLNGHSESKPLSGGNLSVFNENAARSSLGRLSVSQSSDSLGKETKSPGRLSVSQNSNLAKELNFLTSTGSVPGTPQRISLNSSPKTIVGRSVSVPSATTLKRNSVIPVIVPKICIRSELATKSEKEALSCVRKMKDEGIEMSLVTNSIIVRRFAKVGNAKDADNWFKEAKERHTTLNAIIYGNIVYAHCQTCNMDRAEALVREMEEAGIDASIDIYLTMMDGYTMVGNEEKCLIVFARLKECGFTPSVISYECLINLYIKVGEVSKASEVSKMMETASIKHNMKTYSMLINGFLKLKDWANAFAVIEDLMKDGLKPDVVLYNNIITAFCGNMNRAVRTIKEMQRERHRPTSRTFMPIIRGFARAGDMRRALEIFDMMRMSGCIPTVHTFNALVLGLVEKQQKQIMQFSVSTPCYYYPNPKPSTTTTTFSLKPPNSEASFSPLSSSNQLRRPKTITTPPPPPPQPIMLTLVVVENKNGVNNVTTALVELMNESKQEVPNWLNDYAEQSLCYGGDQRQVYGSSNFGGYNFCGSDNYSYCDTSYNGGESNAPGTAGSLSFGNYCFSVSGALYFPNFMITFIEFGFVAIDVGALALVPQIHFSVHMWSNEALLLILLSAIMRSQTMVGKVMNMNLETMVGKVRCGREKELHVNLFKIHREPLEKCVGCALSTLNASCLRVQKLLLVDWAFANVPISWKDVEAKLFALNMVTKVLLQEGNPTGRSDQFKFKAFVLMITSEGKLPCKWLFGLPFSRMVFLICRLIDWKRCQGYHVVLRIAALKIYLFVVLTVWSRLLWLCLRCLSYLKLEDKF